MRDKKIINWIQNFKPENEIIFNAKPIIISDDKILISTNNKITLLNTSGSMLWDLNVKSSIPPVVSGNTIFTLSDDNYLLLINKDSGKILFSKNFYSILKKEYEKKYHKKIKKINSIYLIKDKLLLISNNSFFIEFDLKKNISVNSINKTSFDIASNIIFIDKKMVFVSDKKKIFKVN